MKHLKNKRGFTIIETLVSLFVVLVIFLGIYSIIILSLKLTSDNAFYVEATEIANQKMELLRNLPYDDVGTITGSPVGVINEHETVIQDGTYDVHTSVIFYDDPYDGSQGGTDSVWLDYKIATIKVSWTSKYGAKDVTIFSKIIPNTEESLTGYGLLKLFVVDSSGASVSNADIHIESATGPFNADYVSDTSGELSLPLLPGLEDYKVIITKPNYGTDQTYPRNATNTNPTKPFLSVFDGLKTEESFSIDKLSILTIKTLSNTLPENWPIHTISTSSVSANSSLGIDSSDNLYFVWQEDSISSSSVFVQKYNSAHIKQWSNNKKISNTLFPLNPDIDTDSSGNSFVVWEDNSSTLKAIAYQNPNFKIAQKNKPEIVPSLVQDFQYLKPNYSSIRQPNSTQDNNIFKLFANKVYRGFKYFLDTNSVVAATNAVSFVAKSEASTGSSRTLTIATPSGVLENDILIAFIHHDDESDGPLLQPSGWNTLIASLAPFGWSSDSNGSIFWRAVSASEPGSHTFTLHDDRNEQIAGQIRAYRYVDIASPFDGSISTHNTYRYNQYHPAPSKTIANDDSMLVCGWGADTRTMGDSSPIFPAGMTNTETTYRDYIGIASADLAVNISDSPTGSKTYNANRNVSTASTDWCFVLKPEIVLNDAFVLSLGSQIATTTSPDTDIYIGGAFVIEGVNTVDVTDLSITENGNIDAQNDLTNIKLFYDIDSTAPYDCTSEQYDAGSDSQFGSTSNFDSADGVASFSLGSSVEISPSKSLCIYPVLDILNTAFSSDEIKIEISDPSTDLILNSGIVYPDIAVAISGPTSINKPAVINQAAFRFRNDDGDEVTASWKESQNSPTTSKIGDNLRIRFHLYNQGDLESSAIPYRIEYGLKVSSCSSVSTWESIPTDSTKHWQIISSTFFSNSATTSNVSSGISDYASTFKTGYIMDTSNQTPALTLSSTDFTELEFNIKSTLNATDSEYCFRLSNNGSVFPLIYSEYPSLGIVGDNNIYILGIDSSANNLWATKRVNSDLGNADQINPAIAVSDTLGVATSVIAWEDDRNGNYDIYAQLIDENRNKLWSNDLQITSSSSDEYSVDVEINSNDEIIFTWTNSEASNSNIYIAKYDILGNPLWPENIPVAASSINEYFSKIKIDSSNNIYISWEEEDAGLLDVALAKFDSDANPVWNILLDTSNESYKQYDPSLAISSSYIYVSWTDQRELNNDIYVQKFDFSGNPEWSEDARINVNTGVTSQKESSLIITSLENIVGTWSDNRDSEYNIYATEFNDPQSTINKANVPLMVTGTKKIGESPVYYEYNVDSIVTDSNGEVDILIEWDVPGYSIEINPTSPLTILKRDPITPIQLLPDEIKTIEIYVQ